MTIGTNLTSVSMTDSTPSLEGILLVDSDDKNYKKSTQINRFSANQDFYISTQCLWSCVRSDSVTIGSIVPV